MYIYFFRQTSRRASSYTSNQKQQQTAKVDERKMNEKKRRRTSCRATFASCRERERKREIDRYIYKIRENGRENQNKKL